MLAARSWGEEIQTYDREKRHAVDERLISGPSERLPKGHVQRQERIFDPLLQKFREPGLEASRRSEEGQHSVAHLNRAQDIQIMREQPYNILTLESRLEALAPGQDPTLLGGNPGARRHMGKATNCSVTAVKDYNILSNLPFTQHHWARPEDRPPEKEVKTGRRKLHAHLVKDFNILNNRYTEHHEEKDRQAKHLNLLESTQKYAKQNRFDPVTQQFNDPQHEELVRTAEDARDVELVMRAQSQLPPTFKGRQSAHYGIISHEVHDQEAIRMWDAMEQERTDRYRNRYIFDHNVHAQELKGSHITNARRLNRVAPERFEEPKRRGYDIIDNTDFGQGPKEKPLHEPFTKVRMTPWEKVMEGRTESPALQQQPQQQQQQQQHRHPRRQRDHRQTPSRRLHVQQRRCPAADRGEASAQPPRAEEPSPSSDKRGAAEVLLPRPEYRRLLSLGGKPLTLRGINIQRPWARLILTGAKTIEARRYALKGYLNEDLWVIETKGGSERVRSLWSGCRPSPPADKPDRQGRAPPFVSRIVGVVRFGGSFQYESVAQWRGDEVKHRIPNSSPFDWEGPTEDPKSQMHGWKIVFARALAEPQPGPLEKGMIGCKAVKRLAVWALAAKGTE